MFDPSQQFDMYYLEEFDQEELLNNLPFDPTDEDFKALTIKQQRFIIGYSFKEMAGWTYKKLMEYVTGNPNAPSNHNTYSGRPNVQKFLEKIDYNVVARLGFNVSRIVEEEMAIAYSDITEYLDEQGLIAPLKLKTLPPHIRRAIQSFQIIELPGGVRKLKLALWDKGGALSRMEKIKGMYAPDELKLSGELGVKSADDRAKETQERLLKEMRETGYVDDGDA